MQTVTTLELSDRLLELGINRETADMTLINTKAVERDVPYAEYHVWSLSAVIELLPKVLHKEGQTYEYYLTVCWDYDYKAWHIFYDAIGDNICGENMHKNIFDACINLLEKLIKYGYIKTEKV